MKKLLKLIEVEDEMSRLQEKITPLTAALQRLSSIETELNETLEYREKQFIIKKLIENQTEDERNDVMRYRKEVEDMLNSQASYRGVEKKTFDPEYDEFRIFKFEKDNEGNIRFAVSCKKNEGFVLGMTIFDTHWTSWFKISELYE